MGIVKTDQFTWGNALINIEDKTLPSIKFRHLNDSLKGRKGKLLEVGCGSGRILSSIQHYYGKKFDYHGCDISKLGLKGNPHKVKCCDGLNLAYKNNSFDVVIASDYLEHVPDLKKALAEIHRVLKKGGRFYATVPAEGELSSLWFYTDVVLGLGIGDKTKDHSIKYRKKQIFNAFQEEGFRVQKKWFSYHFLCHLLDFGMFSMTLIPFVSKLFWKKNKYYNPHAKQTLASKVLNVAMDIGNGIAWLEASLLQHMPLGAKYVSLSCTKR